MSVQGSGSKLIWFGGRCHVSAGNAWPADIAVGDPFTVYNDSAGDDAWGLEFLTYAGDSGNPVIYKKFSAVGSVLHCTLPGSISIEGKRFRPFRTPGRIYHARIRLKSCIFEDEIRVKRRSRSSTGRVDTIREMTRQFIAGVHQQYPDVTCDGKDTLDCDLIC